MLKSSGLAIAYWNKTPRNTPAEERYQNYSWLREAAEFQKHAGEHFLEIGCAAGAEGNSLFWAERSPAPPLCSRGVDL